MIESAMARTRRTTEPGSAGRTVRALREAAGLTQQALAHNAGLSRATVAALEHGRYRGTDSKTLEKLAQALGVTPAFLLEGGSGGSAASAHETPELFVQSFEASRWPRAIGATKDELDWLRSLSFAVWRGIDPSPQGTAELIAWRRRNVR